MYLVFTFLSQSDVFEGMRSKGDLYVYISMFLIASLFKRSSSLHSALPKSFRDLVMEEEKYMSANNLPGTATKRAGCKGAEDSPVQSTTR